MSYDLEEFRDRLNRDIAERFLGLQRINRTYAGRPIYHAPPAPKPSHSNSNAFVWVQEGDGRMEAVDFCSWDYVGPVLSRLLPALHPAQFLAELMTMFNWTPQVGRTIAITPLEPEGNLLATHQADGVRTQFGLFCEAYPLVPPYLWKAVIEHLVGLILADQATDAFWDELVGGLQFLDDGQMWLTILANAQNNPVPEEHNRG